VVQFVRASTGFAATIVAATILVGTVIAATVVAATFVVLLTVKPAAAQTAPRTWVASNGSGTTCSRTAPCATFQNAHNATDVGGEINCVDAGEYGGLVITKSITIDCSGFAAGVQTGGVNGIVINAPNAIVTLRGLMIDAAGSGSIGVLFDNGRALHIHKCWISGFRTFDATGIKFAPPAGVSAKLEVADSVISDSGLGLVGGGINIQTTGSGSARVSLARVQVENNSNGVVASSVGGTGGVSLQVRDSLVAGNSLNGIIALTVSSSSTVSITVDRTASVLNGFGVAARGAGTFVILGDSTVASNTTGLVTSDGGAIISYKNNQLEGDAPITGIFER
jgi:hypothetical protein